MKYHYIAIEREYGCGGTQIGEAVAKELGIACCGREIYEKIADELGISAEEVESREENTVNSFLYAVSMLANAQNGNDSNLSLEQKIHLAMQKEMKEIAAKDKCVFIGHCAMEALKDRKNVLKVFIRADDASRNERIIQEYGISPDKVEQVKTRFDKRRKNTFYSYTAKKWDSPDNYDLILDSGKLGIERCVSILAGLLQ